MPPMTRILTPKRRKLLWIVLILLALAILLRFTLLRPKPPAPPSTASVTVTDLEDAVLASGKLEAIRQVSVGAQVSGQLKSLKVALGDRVKAGQLVAEIDSMTQQNELRNAEAGLNTVRAQRRAKEATLKQATLVFKRQAAMLKQDATSREEYETAEATLGVTRAEIAQLDAQIAQAEIQADTARVNLGYTRIASPIDGVVVAIVTKEGQTVSAMQTAPTIIKVAQVDTMTVKAQISEADVVRVRPGQKVYFTILGEPDARHYGELRAVEPAPDSIQQDDSNSLLTSSSSGTSTSAAVYYNGLFDVPNPEETLRISMTAQVNIVLSEAKGARVVPSAALGARGKDGRYTVRVLGADGQVAERQIRVGINNNVSAQVLEGLEEGEKVVVGSVPGAAAAPAGGQPPGPPPGA